MTTYKHWIADVLRSWATTFDDTLRYQDDDEGEKEKSDDEAYDYINLLTDKLISDTCTIDDYDNILFHLFQKFEGEIDVAQLYYPPRRVTQESCPIHPQEDFVSEYITHHFWSTVKEVRAEALKKGY